LASTRQEKIPYPCPQDDPDDPYTSGFIHLNCEYWGNAAEARLWVASVDRLLGSATRVLGEDHEPEAVRINPETPMKLPSMRRSPMSITDPCFFFR
jgi:hypothetical protein